MKQKEILLLGATGQIGRNLIRKLSKSNYKITAATRNIHTAGYKLKTQANPGYLNLVEIKNFSEKNIENLLRNCDICINLIGILYETKKNQFKTIHTDLPDLISKKAKEFNIEKLIHLSSLGVENSRDSIYAESKFNGEQKIKKNFKKSIIVKPSIVYSVDDNFTTNFMTLLSRLPVIPLYYNGQTKFRPIHVSDLTNILHELLNENFNNLTVECVGPQTLNFKEILTILLKLIDKKRLLIPLPLNLAKLSAKFLQIFPKPILTEDQLKLLKYDNIETNNYKTNIDLGLEAKKLFENEVSKYSYNWMSGGQFSKKNKVVDLN
tara:strand:+ start:740 stop:1705 length:966 start_codon:yes stop_codon:yes gene_type:complete